LSSTSEATTHGIRVHVQSHYLPDRSQPELSEWVFAYHVRISNEGSHPARVIGRHWIITDGDGHVEEVEGDDIVGEQPLLEPGESFEYTSGCPLKTPFGTMEGTYRVVTSSGETFNATIAPFSLSEPYAIN
jgi:ApaG protein